MSKKLQAILLLVALTVFLAILFLGVLTVFLAMLVSCPGLVRSGDSFTDSYGDGWTSDVGCDDSDPMVFPGAPEFRDGKDNDCDPDGKADEGLISVGDVIITEIH